MGIRIRIEFLPLKRDGYLNLCFYEVWRELDCVDDWLEGLIQHGFGNRHGNGDTNEDNLIPRTVTLLFLFLPFFPFLFFICKV